MMVRYARARGYKGAGFDPIVTIGNSYFVLGIIFSGNSASRICIGTNNNIGPASFDNAFSNGGPGLFELKYFDITDGRIPSGWIFNDYGSGIYRLDPEEFIGDFWDRYHDSDINAEKEYHAVLSKIIAFHER